MCMYLLIYQQSFRHIQLLGSSITPMPVKPKQISHNASKRVPAIPDCSGPFLDHTNPNQSQSLEGYYEGMPKHWEGTQRIRKPKFQDIFKTHALVIDPEMDLKLCFIEFLVPFGCFCSDSLVWTFFWFAVRCLFWLVSTVLMTRFQIPLKHINVYVGQQRLDDRINYVPISMLIELMQTYGPCMLLIHYWQRFDMHMYGTVPPDNCATYLNVPKANVPGAVTAYSILNSYIYCKYIQLLLMYSYYLWYKASKGLQLNITCTLNALKCSILVLWDTEEIVADMALILFVFFRLPAVIMCTRTSLVLLCNTAFVALTVYRAYSNSAGRPDCNMCRPGCNEWKDRELSCWALSCFKRERSWRPNEGWGRSPDRWRGTPVEQKHWHHHFEVIAGVIFFLSSNFLGSNEVCFSSQPSKNMFGHNI